MSEIPRRIDEGIYDREEYEKALAWARANCREGKDYNTPENRRTPEQKRSDWEMCIKMTLIARDLLTGNPRLAETGYGEEAEGHNAIAGGFQGQRQWTDHFPNGDFMETILNTPFDWNGAREPIPFATENDSLNGATMLLSHLLTGRAQIFSDVRSYWSPDAVRRVTGWQPQGRAADGFIHLINSGATTLDATGKMRDAGAPTMKRFWEITPEDMQKCLAATGWCPASTGYFRGGGFSAHFLTEGGMPVTMARINLVDGLGPYLQIAEGYTVDLPEKVFDTINNRTDPGWPSTFFAPTLTGKGAFTDVYSVMNSWGANHGAISCGHIGGELVTLASILRIPVAMHNVPAEHIFRPSAWNAFGTGDPEGADYRACRNFGPLYGKK